jgi:hypothetical protein
MKQVFSSATVRVVTGERFTDLGWHVSPICFLVGIVGLRRAGSRDFGVLGSRLFAGSKGPFFDLVGQFVASAEVSVTSLIGLQNVQFLSAALDVVETGLSGRF